MPHPRTPPTGAIEQVGQQLRERLIVDEGSAAPSFSFESLNAVASPLSSTVGLGTTFQLWRLSPSAIEGSTPGEANLRKLAKPIGWHHQVRLDDRSLGFARSSNAKPEDGDLSLDVIFVADLAEEIDPAEEINLAEEIDKASTWANRNVAEEKLVHLLTAPAYQIEAMWFVDEAGSSDGDVYIISVPLDSEQLRAATIISADEFVEALRHEPPAMGVIHKKGPQKDT